TIMQRGDNVVSFFEARKQRQEQNREPAPPPAPPLTDDERKQDRAEHLATLRRYPWMLARYPEVARRYADLCAAEQAEWQPKKKQKAGQAKLPLQSAVIDPVDLWAKRDAPALPKGLLPRVIEDYAFQQGRHMAATPAAL